MADFKDVVKQLEKNKVSQDAGFSALETALGADTLAKSQKEENEKNKRKKDEKELSYLQKMGQEVGLLNKNFRDLAKELKSPEGIVGGILGLLASPVLFIVGFFESVIKQFLAVQKVLIPKTFKTISNFFKNIGAGFNKLDKLTGKPLGIFDFKTLGGKIGAVFRTITDTISKPFIAIGNFFKNNKFVKSVGGIFSSISQTVKDLVGVIENAFGGGGDGGKVNRVFTTVKEVFEKVMRISLALGRLFGKFLAPLFIAYDAFVAAFQEERGIFEKFTKFLGAGVGSFINIFITSILDLVKDGISWIAGAIGFTKFEATLDSFSFTEIFNKFMFAVEEIIIGVKDWFTSNLTWKQILDKSGVSDILNDVLEFIKPVTDFVDDVKKWFSGRLDIAIETITTDIFNMSEFVLEFVEDVKKFVKSILDFNLSDTSSIVQKAVGDAVKKIGNIFEDIFNGLVGFARDILPESAQKLLGIDKTQNEKDVEKIKELESEITENQNELNKGDTRTALFQSRKKIIEENRKEIEALQSRLNANNPSTTPVPTIPNQNPNEMRAIAMNNAELEKVALKNSGTTTVIQNIADNSSTVEETSVSKSFSPLQNPNSLISKVAGFAT